MKETHFRKFAKIALIFLCSSSLLEAERLPQVTVLAQSIEVTLKNDQASHRGELSVARITVTLAPPACQP